MVVSGWKSAIGVDRTITESRRVVIVSHCSAAVSVI